MVRPIETRQRCRNCRIAFQWQLPYMRRAWTCQLCQMILLDKYARNRPDASTARRRRIKAHFDQLFNDNREEIFMYIFDTAIQQFCHHRKINWADYAHLIGTNAIINASHIILRLIRRVGDIAVMLSVHKVYTSNRLPLTNIERYGNSDVKYGTNENPDVTTNYDADISDNESDSC